MKFKTIQTAPVTGVGEISTKPSAVRDDCMFRDIKTLIPQLVQYRDYADDYYYSSVNDSDDGEYDDFDDDLTTIDTLREEKQRNLFEQKFSDKKTKTESQNSAINEVERAVVEDSKSDKQP